MSNNQRSIFHRFIATVTPRRLWSKRFWKYVAIFFLLFAVIGWWNLFRSRSLVISPATTRILEPRTDDGRFVAVTKWLRANRPANMNTDQNGARIVYRELRPDSENPFRADMSAISDRHARSRRTKIARELGLDPMIPETTRLENHYSGYGKWVKQKYPPTESGEENRSAQELIDQFNQCDSELQRVMFDEEFARDWIARNNDAIDILVKASNTEIFKFPFGDDSSYDNEWSLCYTLLLPNAQESRHFARILAFRAAWRIKQGDIDGAIEDILAGRRLGIKLGESGDFIVESLVGIAMTGIAATIPINLPGHQPSREQWQRLLDGINATPIRPLQKQLNKIVNENERLAAIDFIQYLAANRRDYSKLYELDIWGFFGNDTAKGDSLLVLLTVYLPLQLGFDWNTVTAEFNRLTDESINEGEFSYLQKTDQITQNRFWYFGGLTLQSRSKMLALKIFRLLSPANNTCKEAVDRAECFTQMQKQTIAMQLYRADHQGKLPPAFTTDESGKALHSWRVLLLPYLGYDLLYRRIRLDEPWDSPHNSQFHLENIPEYRCPSTVLHAGKTGQFEEGQTSYSVVVGDDTLFAPTGGEGKDPAQLRTAEPSREPENMYLIVERCAGVNWMNPTAEITQEDALLGISPFRQNATVPPNRDQLEKSIGSYHPGVANATFYGGNTLAISETEGRRENHEGENTNHSRIPLFVTGRIDNK